jgi:hypothetical protein
MLLNIADTTEFKFSEIMGVHVWTIYENGGQKRKLFYD